MATTRLIPMHVIKGQTVAHTVHERLSYAINPDKTNSGQLVKAYGCEPETAAGEILLCKKQYETYIGAVKRRRVTSCSIRSGSPLNRERSPQRRHKRSVLSWP